MVSADRPPYEQGEGVICASLTDPALLIAAATTTSHGGQLLAPGEVTSEMVYYSRDGGKRWHFAFDTFDQDYSPDPACADGPDGSAHVSMMSTRAKSGDNFLDLPFRILDYRSPDGAKTWDPPVPLPGLRRTHPPYL